MTKIKCQLCGMGVAIDGKHALDSCEKIQRLEAALSRVVSEGEIKTVLDREFDKADKAGWVHTEHIAKCVYALQLQRLRRERVREWQESFFDEDGQCVLCKGEGEHVGNFVCAEMQQALAQLGVPQSEEEVKG